MRNPLPLLLLLVPQFSLAAEPETPPAPAPEAAPQEPAPLVPLVPGPHPETPARAPSKSPKVPMAIDIIPGIGASATEAPDATRELSLNIPGGITGSVDGIEIGGILNIDRHSMSGIQVSGMINAVGGEVEGIQVAGTANLVQGDMDAIQISGSVNLVGGTVEGIQGGIVNIALGSVEGFQAGAVNLAAGVEGFQAGATNVSYGDLEGMQAGVVNITAGMAEGFQVGVFNYARDIDGFALGIVNVFPEGRSHLDFWTDETSMGRVSFKHGGRNFHYIYGAGWQPDMFSMELGLGDHSRLSKALFWDTEIVAENLFLIQAPHAMNAGGELRTRLGLHILPGLALFAGPSYNVLVTNCAPPQGTQYVHHETQEYGVYGWFGFNAGIQLFRDPAPREREVRPDPDKVDVL